MVYNPNQVRTWALTSDNDGTVLNSEFDRLYDNLAGILGGLAKSADYTILTTDNVGVLRASNGVSAVTGKAFNTASPVNVASAAHGLVTGDTIVVQNSSAEDEVGDIHYTITKVDAGNFTLDNVDNSAGAGGTLDYIPDVVITMPSAAAATDQAYTIAKVDAASTGAIRATDGSSDYILEGLGDFVVLKSDGTNWIHLNPLQSGGIPSVTAQPVHEYVIETPIDATARANAMVTGSYNDFHLPELPQNTVSVLVLVQVTNGASADESAGIAFARTGSTKTQDIQIQGARDASNNLKLHGQYWINTLDQTNKLRGKIITANTVVVAFKIVGYKTT